jgi:hypothetical protein
MPIDVRWHDEHPSILIYDFHGAWTLEEFHGAIDEVVQLVDGFEGRLDIITDLIGAKHPRSANTSAMQAAWGRSYKIMPEGYRLAVVVGAGLMLTFFIRTFGRIYTPISEHVRAANTFDEALQLILNDRKEKIAD